jgi:hypothetical protein
MVEMMTTHLSYLRTVNCAVNLSFIHLYSLLCCRSRNISIYDYLHVKIVIFTNIIRKRVIHVKPCTHRVHSLNATRGLVDRVPFTKTLSFICCVYNYRIKK